MKYHEQVALILKGAYLWGEWIRLNCYAGAGSSPTAQRLAQVAELNWRAWRDEQTEEHIITGAQSVVRIAKEFCK